MKAGQAEPSSLPAASSRPRIRRSPLWATPVATSAAIDTTRPPSRTLTYVASSHRYGYVSSASDRDRKASTSASRAAQIRLTSLRLIEAIPRASTRFLDPPRRDAQDVRLLDDRQERSLARRRGSRSDGIRPVADPRDGQVHRPDRVSSVDRGTRCDWSDDAPGRARPCHAGELGHLGLHDAWRGRGRPRAGNRRRRRRSPCAPSRARPFCPRPSLSYLLASSVSLQRREDDAVAASVVGRSAVTPKARDSTDAAVTGGRRRRPCRGRPVWIAGTVRQ